MSSYTYVYVVDSTLLPHVRSQGVVSLRLICDRWLVFLVCVVQLVEAHSKNVISWFAVGCYYSTVKKHDAAQRSDDRLIDPTSMQSASR